MQTQYPIDPRKNFPLPEEEILNLEPTEALAPLTNGEVIGGHTMPGARIILFYFGSLLGKINVSGLFINLKRVKNHFGIFPPAPYIKESKPHMKLVNY